MSTELRILLLLLRLDCSGMRSLARVLPDALAGAARSCEGDAGSGSGSGVTDEPLQVWVRQAEDGGLPTYRQMAEMYEEATGQKIELYGEVTGFEQALIRAASGKNLPDAIIYDTEGLGQLVEWGM